MTMMRVTMVTMMKMMMMRRWVSKAEPKVRGFPKPVTTNRQPGIFCSLLDDGGERGMMGV